MLNKKLVVLFSLFLILLSIAASLYMDFYRFQAESSNKSVDILVDYDEAVILSKANNTTAADILKKFKSAGATGVIVRERTLKDLNQCGDVLIKTGNDIAFLQEINKDFLSSVKVDMKNTYLIMRDKEVYSYLLNQLEAKKKHIFKNESSSDYYILGAHFTARELEKLGLGFMPRDIAVVKEAGMGFVPRLREWSDASPSDVDMLVDYLKEIPDLKIVTFNDPVIPGIANIPHLAQAFSGLKVPLGTFEFFNQQGLSTFALMMDKNMVRGHAISEEEMLAYTPAAALERYTLAVSERNIRFLFVRLFGLNYPDTALEGSLKFISTVKAGIEKEGFTVSQASMLPSLPYSRLIVFVIGLGVIGGGVLMMNALFPLRLTTFLGVLGIAGWLALLYAAPDLARKGFAFLSVIVFPVIGTLAVLKKEPRKLGSAVLALIKLSLISLIGAVIMTGLLADRIYMLKIDGFTGVKLAHVLPLALVGGYILFRDTEPLKKAAEFLNWSLKTKHVLAGMALLAVLGVYIIRTGNTGTMFVSSLETMLREGMDRLLGVRPRTKEFLIGHPAMLLALYYGYDFKKLALVFFGVIGQISLVNTYAHIHTPLIISLTRSFHGLWLGIVIGAAAGIIIKYALKLVAGRIRF